MRSAPWLWRGGSFAYCSVTEIRGYHTWGCVVLGTGGCVLERDIRDRSWSRGSVRRAVLGEPLLRRQRFGAALGKSHGCSCLFFTPGLNEQLWSSDSECKPSPGRKGGCSRGKGEEHPDSAALPGQEVSPCSAAEWGIVL